MASEYKEQNPFTNVAEFVLMFWSINVGKYAMVGQ